MEEDKITNVEFIYRRYKDKRMNLMITRETKAQMEEYSPVRESRSWNQSKIVLRFRDDKITENEDSTKSVITSKDGPSCPDGRRVVSKSTFVIISIKNRTVENIFEKQEFLVWDEESTENEITTKTIPYAQMVGGWFKIIIWYKTSMPI